MSAFATHAKTSAFAAGARVLSSQKKTNNNNNCSSNNNRCERDLFPLFLWKYCRLRNLFFYFVWKDRASISNNHFVFGFCASLSLFPPSRVTIASHTYRIIALTRMTMIMMMRVCALRVTPPLSCVLRARFVIRTRSHSDFEFFSSLFFFLVKTRALTQKTLSILLH